MLQMLNNVDLSDASQANSAIGIVNVLVSPIEDTTKFMDKYETSTFVSTTNDPNNVQNVESSTTKAPSKEESSTEKTKNETDDDVIPNRYQDADKIHDLLKVALALTDVNGLASDLSPYDFAIRLVSDYSGTRLKSE